MQLYLIRHGQSFVNLKEWEGGFTDEGLTMLGQQQAISLAQWLPKEIPTIDAFYCSTMKRARETAEVLAQAYPDREIQFDDRIRELGNNRRDHSPFPEEDFPLEYADFWATEKPFTSGVLNREDGEAWMHFRIRVGMFIEDIAEFHRNDVVLVVCHGGVVEAVFGHIFNIGPWHHCEVWDHNTAITYFEMVEKKNDKTWRLHYHNRIGHLRCLKERS